MNLGNPSRNPSRNPFHIEERPSQEASNATNSRPIRLAGTKRPSAQRTAVQPLGGRVVRAFATKLTAMRVEMLKNALISQVGYNRGLGGYLSFTICQDKFCT